MYTILTFRVPESVTQEIRTVSANHLFQSAFESVLRPFAPHWHEVPHYCHGVNEESKLLVMIASNVFPPK